MQQLITALSILTLVTACSSSQPKWQPAKPSSQWECTTYWSPWSQLCANDSQQAQHMYLMDQEIAKDRRAQIYFCTYSGHATVCD